MDSQRDAPHNPWASFLGIDTIDYSEIPAMPIKSKTTVTKLNNEDMSLFGLCPVYEDLYLTICKTCESILIPQALKAHMELRHGAKVKKKPEPEMLVNAKPKAIPPAAAAAAACPSSAASTLECSSVPSVCSPDTSGQAFLMTLAQPTTEAKPAWPYSLNSVHHHHHRHHHSGAASTAHHPYLTNANIVRVKPENSKLKVLDVPYAKLEQDAARFLPKTLTNKKTVTSHRKELVLNEFAGCSAALGKPMEPPSPVPASASPSSSSDSTLTDNSEGPSQVAKKTPALEKLVLRRGMKGTSRNRKDSTQETYFMVVKQDDRQQNRLADRQQELEKQTNVTHKEKFNEESNGYETKDNNVEQKLNQLETVRDSLISQLFQELQGVKQKLHQCNVSKSELNKELMTVRSQLEEARRMNEIQTETLSKQNSDYKKEIQDLKEKIDILTASTSSFLEQQQMANQACNLPDDDILRKHLQFCEEQKFEFQKRLEQLESELKDFKKFSTEEKRRLDLKVRQYANIISELKRRLDMQISQNEELRTQKDMLEKHLSPEIRFQVKSQIANYQAPQEIYPGHESSIPSPTVPFPDKYLTDLRNIEYCAFQHQMAND